MSSDGDLSGFKNRIFGILALKSGPLTRRHGTGGCRRPMSGRVAQGLILEEENMFDINRKEIEWAGRQLVMETGRVARQADGAVIVTYGETAVLCTAVAQRVPKVGIDFFPLTVNY